jgi:hypothetical protein
VSAAGDQAAAANATTRRTVHLFVAAHLLGVVAIYGMALAVGGGWSTGVFPPPAAAKMPVASRAAPYTTQHTAAPSQALPAWTQRVEVAAPWEGR